MNLTGLHYHQGTPLPEIRLEGDLDLPEAEHPDARVIMTLPSGMASAHAALWWNDTPLLDCGRVGAIGAFSAINGEAAQQILQAAKSALREVGCAMAIGPMNGNTWRRYRFVTETDGRGSFLLEPGNSEFYPLWWREAGFGDLSHYTSSSISLDGVAKFPAGLRDRMEKSGLRIRKLEPAHYDEDLGLIHELSLKCFSKNFLYTPLEKEAFWQATVSCGSGWMWIL